jgi:ribonuclease P protein component
VTRNLIRRQVRSEMSQRLSQLPEGWWVVRLKAPFDPRQFPSASSDALRHAARAELQQLLARAVSGSGVASSAPAGRRGRRHDPS